MGGDEDPAALARTARTRPRRRRGRPRRPGGGGAVPAGRLLPGTADRVRTAGGGRAFVKAVSPAQNDRSPGLHRAEARIATALPPDTPAPRLLGSYDDGDWIALVFTDVEGRHPVTPWRAGELAAVLSTLETMAGALTPAPAAAPTPPPPSGSLTTSAAGGASPSTRRPTSTRGSGPTCPNCAPPPTEGWPRSPATRSATSTSAPTTCCSARTDRSPSSTGPGPAGDRPGWTRCSPSSTCRCTADMTRTRCWPPGH
ncbi:hypothetical protein V2I01_03490 [Micromonospora sp. BRA006-A]|nr:hypothetical protein [Micromonospora sp. BRA006-A]